MNRMRKKPLFSTFLKGVCILYPAYLAALEPDIRKHYDELTDVSEFLGED